MERSKTDPRPLTEATRHEDIDPWNEFLSESSEELQSLQQDTPPTSTAVSALDVATPYDEETITVPTSRSTEIVATPSDIVRVSFADLPLRAPQAEADARVERRVPAVIPAEEADERPRASHVTSFVPRGESRDGAPPRPELVVAPAALNHTPDVPQVEPQTPVRPSPSPILVAAGISLKDVLTRQTPVHWAEAVATVEDLCIVLSARHLATPQVPDLADILITPDGQVILRPGAAGDPDVATLGRTLHALLSTTTTSLPLRLFVTSSISSERFKSVALFADALSYYAVPGRTDLIQALYRRAAAITAVASPAPIVPPVPAPSRAAEKPAGPTLRAKPNTLVWAFGIFAGVCVGTVSALWMWPAAPPATELTLQTKGPRAGEAATSRRHDDWALGPVPAGRRVKTSVAVPSRTPPTAAKSASPSATERPGQPAPPQPPVSNAAMSGPASLPPLAPSYRAQPLPMTTPESNAAPAPAAPAVGGVPVADVALYTDADREVVPPVLLSKRPSTPPAAGGTDSQVTNTVELVVDPSGRVQTVRMVGLPTRLTDTIPLQAYKLLRFTPATKDGHPVSFRYLLRTVVAPR